MVRKSRKVVKKKRNSTKRSNLGMGISPEYVPEFTRQDSIEARRNMKDNADQYLDEVFDQQIDIKSKKMEKNRSNIKENDSKLIDEQRRALSTPWNIVARQVNEKKNKIPSLRQNAKPSPKKPSPKKPSPKKPSPQLQRERVDISQEGELSSDEFDAFFDNLLQTPVPETKVFKSNISAKKRKYSKITDSLRGELLELARNERANKGKGTKKKRNRKKKKKRN